MFLLGSKMKNQTNSRLKIVIKSTNDLGIVIPEIEINNEFWSFVKGFC